MKKSSSLRICKSCMASQWTERIFLRAWLRHIMWAVFCPEATSELQETDTDMHWQIKAKIREEANSELH